MIRVLEGDCREMLKTLPALSVQCCVTSPPYFGLRDYGVEGQIGLETSPDSFVAEMVSVFRAVRRVLRDDGTLWLNLGDSYAGSWGSQGRQGNSGQMAGRSVANARERSKIQAARIEVGAYPSKMTRTGSIPEASDLKPKDLMMIPARVALALQADGWYLRSDIIWAKPNPMPESVTDRPTSAHEHVFLLTKNQRYFYDAEAVREPASESTLARWAQDIDNQAGSGRANGGAKTNGPMKAVGRRRPNGAVNGEFVPGGNTCGVPEAGRNCRNVWTITTQPFSEAHFATFPPELAERCIKAGSAPGDTILDPFAGAFTSLMVADRLQRHGIGIELSPTYAEMARKRLVKDAGMFAELSG